MARLSGKLTAKALGWDRIAIGGETKKVPQDGGRVHLGRFVGIATGLKQTVDNDTGDIQTGLKGQFRGLSTRTDKGEIVEPGKGLVVTAGVCYLPGGIQEMIEGALAAAQETDPRATVQFAIDLFAIPATNKAGYSFDADNLVETAEADPLDALLTAANTSAAALPAPEAESEQPEAAKGKAKATA
jgi:hypothetical protein